MFGYRQLEVYKRALTSFGKYHQLSKYIKIHRAWHDQLFRAHLSILLNIAEGNSRIGNKDQRRFFVIARASTAECMACYECALFLNKLEESEMKKIEADLRQLSAMLYSLIKSKSV